MKRYPAIEISLFGSAALPLFAVFPEHAHLVFAFIVLAYVALQLASAFAFCWALYHGLISEHAPPPFRYSLNSQRGRASWLARRHLECYLRSL